MPIASHQTKPTKPPKPTEFAKPDGSTFTVASVPGFLGLGLTGIVLRHGNNALKIPRVQVTTDLSAEARYYAEYNNEMNIEQMENEKRIYERLGNHIGVVSCFRISADGIEMAYIRNGSLDQYLKNYRQGADNLKAAWLRSLVDTLCYIHERGVLVNDIALRNILVDEDLLLNFVDFGHSSLLPLDSDASSLPTSKDESNDSAVHMDIFHLAFVMYSIVVWKKHEYDLYHPTTTILSSNECSGDECSNEGLMPRWPSFKHLPNTEGALCGDIIRKCWMRAYRSMWEVRDEIYAALPQF